MKTQAELDARATAFVKNMLDGIGQVTDLGDGLLHVTEKPPEIEPPPGVSFADKPMRRFKGSEVSVTVIIDGEPQSSIGPFIDLKTEVLNNAYLGEISTRYDSLFKGCVMSMELKLESNDGFNRLLQGAWSVRTRSGAWLVKGKGPTRRYSTNVLAEREVQRRRKAKGGRR